jgi:malonate transporter
LQPIINTALPFFALIFCGYRAGRFRLLSEASITGVNAFVFYFALPTFLFSLMATSPLANVVNGAFVAPGSEESSHLDIHPTRSII